MGCVQIMRWSTYQFMRWVLSLSAKLPNPKRHHLPSPLDMAGSFHLTLFQSHYHQRFSSSYMGFLVHGFSIWVSFLLGGLVGFLSILWFNVIFVGCWWFNTKIFGWWLGGCDWSWWWLYFFPIYDLILGWLVVVCACIWGCLVVAGGGLHFQVSMSYQTLENVLHKKILHVKFYTWKCFTSKQIER